jgi:hypothetical protein
MSWNPEEDGPRAPAKFVEIEDRMIYGRNYYNWAAAPKYHRQHQFPTQYRDYPQFRHELSLYKPPIPPQFRDMVPQDKRQYYFRHVEPPTYYEMWGY